MKNIFIMITITLIIIYGLYISKVTMFDGIKKIIIDKPYNKLLIVAHPDDETLWGYYQLKDSKGWKILCVTNANNITRVGELKKIGKVSVPKECWKVVHDLKTKEWFFFLFSNVPDKPSGLKSHEVDRETIEKLSGFKFK